MAFAYANASSAEDCDIVLFGVADESGSLAKRKGAAQGPRAFRHASNERQTFLRKGKKIVFMPQSCKMRKTIFDAGNIPKATAPNFVRNLLKNGKFPVCIGGDHSITADILKGFDAAKKRTSVIYIDSHPDFICSSRNYFGSVMCDVSAYKHIDFERSAEIGIRQPELEELKNIRKRHLRTYTMYEIQKKGLGKMISEIKKKSGRRIYLSVDMDAVDPAFAPGTSTPVPGGLSSSELIYLLKELAGSSLVGMDVMELCPPYDRQGMTAHLAVKAVLETTACL